MENERVKVQDILRKFEKRSVSFTETSKTVTNPSSTGTGSDFRETKLSAGNRNDVTSDVRSGHVVTSPIKKSPIRSKTMTNDERKSVVSEITRMFQDRFDVNDVQKEVKDEIKRERGELRSRKAFKVEENCEKRTGFVENNRKTGPIKPIRTFAHDEYLNKKQLNDLKVFRARSDSTTKPILPPKPVTRSKTVPNMVTRCKTVPNVVFSESNESKKVGNGSKGKVSRPTAPPPPRPTSERTNLTKPNAVIRTHSSRTADKGVYEVLKRSYSDEHIYDEPWKSDCYGFVLDRDRNGRLVNCDAVFIDNEIYGTGSNDENQKSDTETGRGRGRCRKEAQSETKAKELHYMSSPVVACPSPSTLERGNVLRRSRSRSVSAKVYRQPGRNFARNAIRRHVRDKDLVNWSIYATTRPRPRHDPKDNGNDSGDSETDISEKQVKERIAYIQRISRGPSLKKECKINVSTYRNQFDAVLTVGLQFANDGKSFQPFVKDVFPFLDSLKADSNTVARFCFPDAESWRPTATGDTHTFVLTDELGERLFGYCRRVKPEGANSSIPIVYCIISPILARSYYSQVLTEIEKRHGLSVSDMKVFLHALHNRSVPHPGRTIHLRSLSNAGVPANVSFSRLNDFGLDNGDTCCLLDRLTISNLLTIFSSFLLERRVLFFASSVNALTESILALVALLYPFTWQHTLIPILPATMLDIVSSPTPYVIGIMKSAYPLLSDIPLEEGIVVDLDESQVNFEAGDEDTILPKKIHKALTASLKFIKRRSEVPGTPSSLLISEAFLTVFVKLVGHYQQHIECSNSGQKTFNRESFCSAPTSRSEQLFLEWFTETQMFEIFINKKLTASIADNDVFEKHIEKFRLEPEVFKPTIRTNVFGLGKKVKTLGEKLIRITSPKQV